MNNYHPEKDKEPGAYEWWYTDAELDNGCTLNITFFHTDFTGSRYKAFLAQYAKDPSIPYNALDYANVKMSLSDQEGNLLFFGDQNFNAATVRLSEDRVEGSWGEQCHIRIRETGRFPELIMNVTVADGNGNVGKAEVIYQPIVGGAKIGRGNIVDQEVNGVRLYHRWVVPMPTAKVKVNMTFTDNQGRVTEVIQNGYGYHDHNWGNHPLPQTVDRWYWGRIAEPDMSIVFAKVWTLVPSCPFYTPCLFTYGDRIIASTEQIDLVENKIIRGGLQNLTYTTEPTVKFLDGAGVKGEMQIRNLDFLIGLECYLRFSGNYRLNVETAHGKIAREGRIVLEYMDLTESVKRAMSGS